MSTELKIADTWDGNIFSVAGQTKEYLRKAGRDDLAKKVQEIMKKHSYHEALGHCVSLLEEAGYEVS